MSTDNTAPVYSGDGEADAAMEFFDAMALYAPPEKPWAIRARANEALRQKLETIVTLWKAHAEARGDNAAQVDMSHVIRRLLTVAADQALAEYGGVPEDQQALEEMLAAIREGVRQAKLKKR